MDGARGEEELMERMKRSMSNELEQRRAVWESDVMRMQDEFYRGKLGDNKPSGSVSRQPSSPGSPQIFQHHFNVQGYEPEEINLRIEGTKLIVSAKNLKGDEAMNGAARQFTKQMQIPEGVNTDKLTSYIGSDGTLTVEAPYQAHHHPTSPPLTPSRLTSLNDPSRRSVSTTPVIPRGITSEYVHDTGHGRMFRLDIDLGSRDYKPMEVKVKVMRDKVSVSARHEELRQGRTSRREFQKDFDIPEPLEMRTLRAVLDVQTGVVYVRASLASNPQHNMVEHFIMRDIPPLARQVDIEKLY